MNYYKLSSILMLITSVASAQLDVRIDFGNASLSGGNWNNVTTSFTNVPLIDFNTGAATGINAIHGVFNATTDGTINTDWVTTDATSDYIFTTQQVANIASLNNVPAGDYTLEIVYTANFADDQNGALFSITSSGGALADRTFQNNPVPSTEWNAKLDGFQKNDWLIWDSIQPDINGNIFIQTNKPFPGFNSAGLNAIRLTAVPEPAAYQLMGLGVAAASVLLFKRRKQKQA